VSQPDSQLGTKCSVKVTKMEVAVLSTPEEVVNQVDEEKQRAFYESVRETIVSFRGESWVCLRNTRGS